MSQPPAEHAHGLRVDRLTVRYGSRLALDRVDVECAPGQILGLLGPNGAGKSTLLKAILGLAPRESGSVTLDGRSLDTSARARIAYTPQTNDVDWTFPISAEEVAVLGRQGRRGLFGAPDRDDWRLARGALDRLGVMSLSRRQIGELSGGERQRVFLARALAQNGDVLLLDEPLTGVDSQTQAVVLDVIAEVRASGRAVLMTTHDLVRAAEVCDTVCLLNQRVVAAGAPASVLTPHSLMEAYGGGEVLRLWGEDLVGLPHTGEHHPDEHESPASRPSWPGSR